MNKRCLFLLCAALLALVSCKSLEPITTGKNKAIDKDDETATTVKDTEPKTGTQEDTSEHSPDDIAAILEQMLANGEDISDFLPDTAAGGNPTSHAWDYLNAYGVERSGYGVYSYVLFAQENNETARAQYFELVDIIQNSTVSSQSLPEQANLAKFNVFLIPVEAYDYDSNKHQPNYELSRLLLTALASTSDLNLQKQGPFIISLAKPISFGDDNEQLDILYIDLSNTPQAALGEIVRTYKNHIVTEDIEGIKALKSLRLSLLNYALIAEQNIGFAKAAYADLQKSFFDQ